MPDLVYCRLKIFTISIKFKSYSNTFNFNENTFRFIRKI